MAQPDIDESYERGFVAGMQEQMKRSVDRAVNASADDRHYAAGWNAALDLIAFDLIDEFKTAFGDDTLASIAVWIKEQKK